MARHVVVIDVEDETSCLVCMYPAKSCICDRPEILREEEMRRIWHHQTWRAVVTEAGRYLGGLFRRMTKRADR